MKAIHREISDYLELSCGVKSESTKKILMLVVGSLICAVPISLILLTWTLGYIPGRPGPIYPGSFSYDIIFFGLIVMVLAVAHVLWLTLFGDKRFKYYVLTAAVVMLLVAILKMV